MKTIKNIFILSLMISFIVMLSGCKGDELSKEINYPEIEVTRNGTVRNMLMTDNYFPDGVIFDIETEYSIVTVRFERDGNFYYVKRAGDLITDVGTYVMFIMFDTQPEETYEFIIDRTAPHSDMNLEKSVCTKQIITITDRIGSVIKATLNGENVSIYTLRILEPGDYILVLEDNSGNISVQQFSVINCQD